MSKSHDRFAIYAATPESVREAVRDGSLDDLEKALADLGSWSDVARFENLESAHDFRNILIRARYAAHAIRTRRT